MNGIGSTGELLALLSNSWVLLVDLVFSGLGTEFKSSQEVLLVLRRDGANVMLTPILAEIPLVLLILPSLSWFI